MEVFHFLDKTDVLIKNLSGKTEMLDITNGDIQIKLLPFKFPYPITLLQILDI